MSEKNRLQREQEFQDARILEEDMSRKPAEKYYVLMQRPRDEYTHRVFQLSRNRRLLEYGCSDGESTRVWAEQGAVTTGIDLSPEAIRVARGRAAATGLSIRYEVMDAESMTFHDHDFDVVAGTGILHHLDLSRAYAEIARVLDDDGRAVFIEPMGHNPLINLYRRLTPAMRSEDEHPLKTGDIRLAESFFERVDCRYYNLFTLASVPLRGTPLFRPLHTALRALDSALFTLLPFTRRFAWMVLIECSRPRRQN